jgi:hypothetical protein
MIEIEELDDPMHNFKDALKSDSAKRQYPVRLKYFFDSLYTKENENFKALDHININDQINEFMSYKNDRQKIEQCFRKMLRIQTKRVKSGAISEGTIYNYYKAAKVFCDQNDIIATWKKITKIIPTGRRDADDRVPTDEEIQRLIMYPDRRLKPIVFTMISSGIRIEAWNYLKWKHIEPKYDDEKLLGAKIIVYAGEREQYYSFITPEAYNYLKSYMDYRALHGEEINGNSWVMRNLFESTIKNGVNLGKPKIPKRLSATGIKSLLERAATSEGLFKPLDNGEKRREWKVAHGLRKLMKTRCETAGMRSLHIEMLLGHNVGVTKSYYRPLESEMLEDYQKAIPLLTIEEANKKLDKITTQIRNEMKGEVRTLRKEFLIYMFKKEEESFSHLIQESYERYGRNISPATHDMPQKVIQKILEDTRKDEHDPNLTVDEIAFITPKMIIDRVRKSYPLNNEDFEMLNEYIKEKVDADNGKDEVDINNGIMLFHPLPSELAYNLGVHQEFNVEYTPDEIRAKWKNEPRKKQ